MRDYRVNKKENLDYILTVEETAETVGMRETADGQEPIVEETYDIRFADGKVYTGILRTTENLEKILDIQEEQAEAGIANLPTFKKRKTLSGIMTAASIVGGPIIAGVAGTTMHMKPLEMAITGGVLTLAALIPSAISFVKNKRTVAELEVVKFRNEKLDQLVKYPTYVNALVGLDEKTAAWYENQAGKNPFSIANIDRLSLDDLSTIIENEDREDQLKQDGLQFIKPKQHVKK